MYHWHVCTSAVMLGWGAGRGRVQGSAIRQAPIPAQEAARPCFAGADPGSAASPTVRGQMFPSGREAPAAQDMALVHRPHQSGAAYSGLFSKKTGGTLVAAWLSLDTVLAPPHPQWPGSPRLGCQCTSFRCGYISWGLDRTGLFLTSELQCWQRCIWVDSCTVLLYSTVGHEQKPSQGFQSGLDAESSLRLHTEVGDCCDFGRTQGPAEVSAY